MPWKYGSISWVVPIPGNANYFCLVHSDAADGNMGFKNINGDALTLIEYD